jgi:LysR family transcriptional regulator, regulator of abg operon
MEVQQLRHLIAAIETGNLLRAADKSCISQSGLSRSIKTLETTLGVPLLIRGPKGSSPRSMACR